MKEKNKTITSNLTIIIVTLLLFFIGIGVFYDLVCSNKLKIYTSKLDNIAASFEKIIYRNHVRGEEFRTIYQETGDVDISFRIIEKSLSSKASQQIGVSIYNSKTGMFFESYKMNWGCTKKRTYPNDNNDIFNTTKFIIGLSNTETIITKPYMYNYSDDYSVKIVSTILPLSDSEGKYNGFISVDMLSSDFQYLSNNSIKSDEGYLYIVDSLGEIIYHPDDSFIGVDVKEPINSVSSKRRIQVSTRISQPFLFKQSSPYTGSASFYIGGPVIRSINTENNWNVVMVVPFIKFHEDFLKITILFSLLGILTYFLLTINNKIKSI